MLDQSITSLARVEQAIDLGSCQMVRIDLARVGGITPALAIRKAAKKRIFRAVSAAGRTAKSRLRPRPRWLPRASCRCQAIPIVGKQMPWLMSDSATLMERGAAGNAEIRLPADTPDWGFLLDTEMMAHAVVERATLR